MIEDYQANYFSGWIKLYRSIKKHWIWENPYYLKWWIAILIEVNHSGQKFALGYNLVDIEKGQSCHSIRQWADLFGCSTKTVQKFFKLLEKDDMISREIIGSGKQSTTLVTVSNYGQYQGQVETQSTTQGKRKGNAEETQGSDKQEANNNKNDKKGAQPMWDFANQTINRWQTLDRDEIVKAVATNKATDLQFTQWATNILSRAYLEIHEEPTATSTDDYVKPFMDWARNQRFEIVANFCEACISEQSEFVSKKIKADQMDWMLKNAQEIISNGSDFQMVKKMNEYV